MITADGNHFKSLANKKTEVEDDAKICIEQIVADALEHVDAHEHVTNTKNKAKRATANCVHVAAIGDIIALVIAAIQPVIVKSITVAVTSAVEAAIEQIMANVRREMSVIEEVGKKRSSLQVETTNSALFMKLGSLLYVVSPPFGEEHRGLEQDISFPANKHLLILGKCYAVWDT